MRKKKEENKETLTIREEKDEGERERGHLLGDAKKMVSIEKQKGKKTNKEEERK